MNKKSVYTTISFAICLILAALISAPAWAAGSPQGGDQPQEDQDIQAVVGTAFTYQGYLTDAGKEADGSYDLRFRLYDASGAGTQVGATVTLENFVVNDGLFNVKLNFGVSAFGGGARWLQIDVRPGASTGTFTALSPRQELTPAPYALGMPNVYTDESLNFVGIGRNFRISNNEVFGVRYVGNANQYGGMYVETSNAAGWPFYGYATNGAFRAWTYYDGSTSDWNLYNAGLRLKVPDTGGLRIGPSADYSLVISDTTGSDGIRVLGTGDDAIQLGSSPSTSNYGVYIPSPGVRNYGLWPNTQNAAGEWALYTTDNIQAGNVLANAYSLVAQVTGSDALRMGDVVAVTGVTIPIPGSTNPLPLVRPADSTTFSGVIGVVQSRMVWEVAPGKEDEGAMSMHSADGPAQPGEYVSLIVSGIAQVNIAPDSGIIAGDRLTASEQVSLARALKSQEIDGMLVVEGAPVFGIALETPTEGQTVIAVFVTLR
ncbi:MAG TPA: hypothetical protein PKM21_18830 [Anaerolineales bacterium]|nr:hypothetical protein [Anaerolineales bacterium]